MTAALLVAEEYGVFPFKCGDKTRKHVSAMVHVQNVVREIRTSSTEFDRANGFAKWIQNTSVADLDLTLLAIASDTIMNGLWDRLDAFHDLVLNHESLLAWFPKHAQLVCKLIEASVLGKNAHATKFLELLRRKSFIRPDQGEIRTTPMSLAEFVVRCRKRVLVEADENRDKNYLDVLIKLGPAAWVGVDSADFDFTYLLADLRSWCDCPDFIWQKLSSSSSMLGALLHKSSVENASVDTFTRIYTRIISNPHPLKFRNEHDEYDEHDPSECLNAFCLESQYHWQYSRSGNLRDAPFIRNFSDEHMNVHPLRAVLDRLYERVPLRGPRGSAAHHSVPQCGPKGDPDTPARRDPRSSNAFRDRSHKTHETGSENSQYMGPSAHVAVECSRDPRAFLTKQNENGISLLGLAAFLCDYCDCPCYLDMFSDYVDAVDVEHVRRIPKQWRYDLHIAMPRWYQLDSKHGVVITTLSQNTITQIPLSRTVQIWNHFSTFSDLRGTEFKLKIPSTVKRLLLAESEPHTLFQGLTAALRTKYESIGVQVSPTTYNYRSSYSLSYKGRELIPTCSFIVDDVEFDQARQSFTFVGTLPLRNVRIKGIASLTDAGSKFTFVLASCLKLAQDDPNAHSCFCCNCRRL